VIRVTPEQNSPLSLHASVAGLAVFLDAFAIKELARRNPSRRKRFIAATKRGAEVLFSVSNAAELSGPQGDSFVEIRDFMNEIGPHWFPVELDPIIVTQREKQGKPADESCFCGDFLKDYLRSRLRMSPQEKVIGVSEELFALGHVMDWLAPQRDSIARGKKDLDRALIEKIKDHRCKYEADPGWLDKHFPVLPFNPAFPGMFAYVNMVRMLILESRSFAMMPGDGIDFCQAVIGSAFSTFATLDKKWKRRVDMLPRPNKLARIYYSPELDTLVDDVESSIVQMQG
jgi:hypothetical protein